MFSEYEGSAACIEDFEGIKKGAIVPKENEMYSIVKKWLDSNEWAQMPASFFDIKESDEQINARRAAAYSDPINGSDRHYMEALRKESKGDAKGATEAKALGSLRSDEIKAQYPINN